MTKKKLESSSSTSKYLLTVFVTRFSLLAYLYSNDNPKNKEKQRKISNAEKREMKLPINNILSMIAWDEMKGGARGWARK